MIMLLIGIVIMLTAALFFLLWQTKTNTSNANYAMKHEMEALRNDFRENLNNLVTQMNCRLNDNTSLLGQRLDNAATVIGSVKEHLGRLHEASSRIFEIGKDISSLQDLLRAPKIRGGLGEYFLEGLLSQIMPAKEYYQMQYSFKSGQKVDAVLKLGQRLVPIDSKFPLENFRAVIAAPTEEQRRLLRRQFINDVKKHISDISAKYIVPDEGTFDFALMYIPAENVYYETIIKDEKLAEDSGLFQYALSKKVVPVSPNSFYAYLQVILLGLKGMAIEKGAQQMLSSLDRIRGDFERFYEEFMKLGKHIGNSRGSFEDAEKRLLKIQEKILQLNGLNKEAALQYDNEKIPS